MVIFHSYVSLPEGTPSYHPLHDILVENQVLLVIGFINHHKNHIGLTIKTIINHHENHKLSIMMVKYG
jgi:hypothetical protein